MKKLLLLVAVLLSLVTMSFAQRPHPVRHKKRVVHHHRKHHVVHHRKPVHHK